MKSIVVASTNPVKVQAALAGFKKMFPEQDFQSEMVVASSEVSDQPATDEETFRGALNRARGAARLAPQADYWIGIEGGVQDCAYPECKGEMMAFAWVVILKDEGGRMRDERERMRDEGERMEDEGGRMKDERGRMAEVNTSSEFGEFLIGKGRTGSFFLPKPVVSLIRQGMELGEADDAIFGRFNSKQENGAVGILTGDVIDRARLYEHAVTLALIPFRNRELYV